VTYHAGTYGLSALGIPDGEARVTCDIVGCTAVHYVGRPGSRPPAWLLNGKAPPRWKRTPAIVGKPRVDLCPACKEASHV